MVYRYPHLLYTQGLNKEWHTPKKIKTELKRPKPKKKKVEKPKKEKPPKVESGELETFFLLKTFNFTHSFLESK